jgi:hypothetical protein
MNERIRKLIFESVRFDLDPDSNHYEAQIDPEDLEDFAELIVEECAKFVDSAISDGGVDGQSVKQHFGVGE